MKLTLILAFTMILSLPAFAQDMSRTETYAESYQDKEDGSNEYIGGCSLHQDYEGKLFDVLSTIVETVEPSWSNPKDTMLALKNVEKELLVAAAGKEDIEEFFTHVDDFTLEKITGAIFTQLDLYRFNIGVGGGNGYFAVFNRENINGKVTYTQLSNVFDGDVEYCDKSVWLKK